MIPLLKHEIRKLTRDPTFLFLFTVQIFVVLSSIYASSIYSSFYDAEELAKSRNLRNRVIRIGVVSLEDNNTIIYELSETPKTEIFIYSDFEDAKKAYAIGDIDAILALPNYASLYEEEDVQLVNTLVVEKGSIESSYIMSFVKDAFERAKEKIRETREESLFLYKYPEPEIMGGEGSPYIADSAYFFLIPFIIIFPAVGAGALLLDNFIEERKEKTMEELRLAPVKKEEILLSKAIPLIAVSVIQAGIPLIVLGNIVKIENSVFLILLSAVLTFINCTLALISDSLGVTRQDKQAIYTSLIFPAGLLFSPLLPQPVYSIASSPLRWGAVYYLIIPVLGIFIFNYSIRMFRKEDD